MKELFKEPVDLPTLPQIARRIISLSVDLKTAPLDLRLVVSRDPAFASKMLKVVNSAYYGISQKIYNLNQAIVILGPATLKSVGLSVSVVSLFPAHKRQGRFVRERFWRHSIACACINRCVALKNKEVESELAFSTGLLHDIGKLVLDTHCHEETNRIVETAEKKKLSFRKAEEEVSAPSHDKVGGWLAQRWYLPDQLAQGIAAHHSIETAKDKRLVAVNLFAHYVCLLKGLQASGSCEKPSLDGAVRDLLKLKKTDIAGIIKTLNDELRLAELFLKP